MRAQASQQSEEASARQAEAEGHREELAPVLAAAEPPRPRRRSDTSQSRLELRSASTTDAFARARFTVVTYLAVAMLLGIFVAGSGALGVYFWKAPVLAEGAFGHATPVNRSESVAAGQLEEARRVAVAASQVPSAVGGVAGYQWRRVVLIYHTHFGDVASVKGLKQMQEMEAKLRNLPGWRRLCIEEVPQQMRSLCLEGDSLASSLFGSLKEVRPSMASKGVLSNISFDGEGDAEVISFETLLEYFSGGAESALKRWLPEDGSMKACRSTFAFYLPASVSGERWAAMVQNEVESFLNQRDAELDEVPPPKDLKAGDVTPLRVFLMADNVEGIRRRAFGATVDSEMLKWMLCPLSTLIGTMIGTQRVLLSIVAALIAITAPITASVAIIGPARDEPQELPMVALAAWFAVAVACADMATASARFSQVLEEAEHESAGGRQDEQGATSGRQRSVRRLLAFMWRVIAPQVAAGGGCLVLSLFVGDLPLASEFCRHLGADLFVAALYTVLVCPTAAAFGDHLLRLQQLHEGAKAGGDSKMKEVPTGDPVTYMVTCAVFGEAPGSGKRTKKMEARLANIIKHALTSWHLRGMAVFSAVLVLLGLVLTEWWPSFSLSTPALFEPGYPLREGKQAQLLFGALPAPQAMLRTNDFLQCTVDAHASAGCSMHVCQSTARQHPAEECNCFYQRSETRGCHGAVARLWGASELALQQRYWEYFWVWADKGLRAESIELGGISAGQACSSCVAAPKRVPVLQMSDWSTGGALDINGVSAGYDEFYPPSFPDVEDACVRLTCTCGATRCRSNTSDWMYQNWQPLCKTGCAASLMIPEKMPRRLVAAGDAKEDGLIEVTVVFGLAQPRDPPLMASGELPPFNSTFQIEDVWAQRSVLSFCESTSPGLEIVSRMCWAIDFKRWLSARGEHYPVASDRFYERFALFAKDASGKSQGAKKAKDLESTFWLDHDGRMRGFFVVFRIKRPEVGEEGRVVEAWTEYVDLRNRISSATAARAWLVLPLSEAQEELEALESGVRNTVLLTIASATVASLVLTLSVRLTLAMVLSLLLALGFLAVVVTGFGGRAVGVLEVVILATFMTSLTAPLLRIASRYAAATDGPGVHPAQRSKVNAHKMQSMISDVHCRDSTQITSMFDEVLPFWVGAVSAERLARAATTVLRESLAVVAAAAAALIAGPTLVFTSMEALGQVGMTILCASVTAIPLALGVMPMLFSIGLAPSRVRNEAFASFWTWCGEGRPSPYASAEGVDAQAAQGVEAALVLGWPFSLCVTWEHTTSQEASEDGAVVESGRRRAPPQRGAPSDMDLDESTGGNRILALDLHGATAMPPYHVAMEVRDKLKSTG